MDPSNAIAEVITAPPVQLEDARPAAVLRGTSRGLEVHVNGLATVDAIASAVLKRLEEAPGFFRGSNVRIKVEDGPLAAGCLARLDEIATTFDLRIIEVGAAKKGAASDGDAVPQPNLAAGSAPSPAQVFDDAVTNTAAAAFSPPALTPVPQVDLEPITLAAGDLVEIAQLELVDDGAVSFEEPTQTAAPISLAATAEAELETVTAGTRLVVGPVRSGVILEHAGNLIVFGDVNPGAEIRAEGNIVVLGRLRGTAHAGIGQDVGFILSLRLEPQQLRIGRKVARAADSDAAASDAEIAYCTGDSIVVERYLGKLPRNLASTI